MLTREENEQLTRVGPGTPAGELLRRYWHPVAVAQELTPEQPTKFVRLMGENLVLFRDKLGRVGLIGDRCSHRSASLCYGRVEERGISCAYHGWLFDTQGNILETPPERNEAIINSVKHLAYPVRKFVGMYWAYLGPEPAPLLPPYDLFTRPTGTRQLIVHPMLDCNWFQAMENSADPDHLQILHQEFLTRADHQPVNSTRGFIDEVAQTDFYTTGYGLMKKRTYKDGRVDEHPLIFPNMLRQGYGMQIRVPVDDTHTLHFQLFYSPGDEVVDPEADLPVEYRESYKLPPDRLHPYARYTMDSVLAQDHAMWETQGPIADRSLEHLSYSDRGVALLRKVMQEQLEIVARGGDPMGLYRGAEGMIVDTNYEESVKAEGSAIPALVTAEAHKIKVPAGAADD
jgi:5,5'-dehydrodivanillate O-demethylase oxygenase subunit